MATPKENSLSLGHLTDTFAKQRQHWPKKSVNTPMLFQADLSAPQSHQHLRKMHLQQRLLELKERELTARQHNRQLLQQFDEAQDTLRGMFTLTANMKTIRVEYERYLEESAPRWQQQLREQTQAAQRKRMEEVLKSCLKNAEDQVMKSSAGSTTKPQKTAPVQKHYGHNSPFDYTQDGLPHLPYTQPARQTHPHTQTSRFPIGAPHQPPGPSHVPPSSLPPPVFSHPFHLGHHHPWPRQTHPQPDWSWAAGIPPGTEALWGQLYMEELPPEREAVPVAREEVETSRAPSSKRERGGGSGSSLLSQELDVKPVRLSGSPAESSDSSRESSRASREKRAKRGGSRRPSSDRERRSSQESSGSSSAIVVVVAAAVTAAKSSKSDASSERSRTGGGGRRSAGLAVGSPRPEKVEKEGSRSKGEDSESQSTGEESRSGEEEEGDQSAGAKSLSCREESGSQEEKEEDEEDEEEEEEESGSVSLKIEEGGGGQSGSSEQSDEGVKEEVDAQDPGGGDEEEDDSEEKEESQGDEEQEVKGGVEEEEEEMKEQESEEEGDEEETSDGLKNEENRGDGPEDEEEGEGEGDKLEEGESGEEDEEEQRGDEAGEPEEGDSEDSIISPQSKPTKVHIVPEEAGEDEEEDEDDEGATGSSDSNENSDEDIENLLAPQERSQKKEEKNVKAEEKDKGTCDRVQIFQAETSPKRDRQSDSEEFDDFYD